MNFYKNVIEHKGKLLIRGVLNGKDYKEKIDFGLLSTLTQEHSQYKTLQGQFLKLLSLLILVQAVSFVKRLQLITLLFLVLKDITINILVTEYPEDINGIKGILKYLH